MIMNKYAWYDKRFNELESELLKDPDNPRIRLKLDRLWEQFGEYRSHR